MKEYRFSVTGGFDVSENLQPIYDSNNNITGFKMPDGQTIKLVVSLEYNNPHIPQGPVQTVGEEQMEHLGFKNLAYDETVFEGAE